MTFFMKYKKKIFGILFETGLICVLLLSSVQNTNAQEDLNLHAQAYALMDGDSGRVLAEKAGNDAMANASTTKILTCIVALENGNVDDTIVFSKNAASQPEVHLGLKENVSISLRDALLCLMLESYNDCAVAIAEHIGGSCEDFAELLNNKAKELGCSNTYFITPNGLDREDENSFHHSSAIDLCLMMKYCCFESEKAEVFRQICQTKEHSFSASDNRVYQIYNRNKLLFENGRIVAGKTGYTSKAGYCYVAAFEEKEKKYCICVLASGWPNHKNFRWEDTNSLLQYGDANFVPYVFKKPDSLKGYVLKLNGYEEIPTLEQWKTPTEISYEILGSDKKGLVENTEILKKSVFFRQDIDDSLDLDECIGNIYEYADEEEMNLYRIVSKSEIHKWDYLPLFWAILNKFFAL